MPTLQKKKPKTRLDFRLDMEAKEAITQAAHITGKSLSEFAVSSLTRSAQEVLEKHQTITLSNSDFDAFLEAIESDAEPNDALKQAAERYRQRFSGGRVVAVNEEPVFELLTEKHDRILFDCGEPSLNEYLQRFARQNAELFLGRTYVLVVPGHSRIEGYYTISSGSVARADMPEKRLPRYPVPVVLVGRLAVDRTAQGQGFGELLLLDALKRSAQLAQHLGIYAVVVDALNEQASHFYRKYGFAETVGDPMRLYLPIKKVLQTVISSP